MTVATGVKATLYGTPGAANDVSCWAGDVAPCTIDNLYVSEAHTSGDPADYIEIYNAGSECSMAGMMLDDSASMEDMTFGDNVTLAAGDYWLGYKNDANSFGSGLSSGGDEVHLCDTAGNCENVVLGPSEADSAGTPQAAAQCFTPEGEGCYCDGTPGTDNNACIVIEILPCSINDVHVSEAHTSGAPADYIELYNAGSQACTLEGGMLDDSASMSDLTFNANHMIDAYSYLVFSETRENSFGSGLSSGGDEVHYCDASGHVKTLYWVLLSIMAMHSVSRQTARDRRTTVLHHQAKPTWHALPVMYQFVLYRMYTSTKLIRPDILQTTLKLRMLVQWSAHWRAFISMILPLFPIWCSKQTFTL